LISHVEPVADTSMELRTTVKVKRSGVEVAVLLLMGVVVAVSVLTLIMVWRKR
jgi:hypothetical protein